MPITTPAPSLSFNRFFNIIAGDRSETKQKRHGINPSTLEPLEDVPVSGPADVDSAVVSAQKAAVGWRCTPLVDRQKALLLYADAIEAQMDGFSKQLVTEQGKPVSAAVTELQESVKSIRGIAQLPFYEDEVIEDTEERRIITRYVPMGLRQGVAVGIIPWNFPILMYAFKIGPALVAGCPIIIKPSPFTPYSAIKLVELAQGYFPPGVVQVLSGDDSLGPLLTVHPGVNKISFTGSTATGRKILESSAKTLKRVTLELGGNDSAIVCGDVDIATVAPQVTAFALYNSGQVCVGIKRVYVHSSIYRKFLNAMVQAAKSLVVADGFNETAFTGPIQNKTQYDRVQEFIRSVREGNYEVALGEEEGINFPGKGYFINPIIVDNPSEDSKIVQEEPFGPIFPVLQWEDEEDVIQRANGTEMGLGASIWTHDLDRADRMSRKLEAGNIWINSHMAIHPSATFGGHKSSGIGSELGIDGIKSFCNTQSVYTYKAH
ncbi:uncharacterized protein E0L32_007900 [Thyridium curvatum]|uniref:aldehyde dehydrogenase (NAD(+)) n=1 Tax=Thyridium curvatum TaxID=1093900 RepID=A0A507B336_9PEZI|nr:uncharacterized protein E0L32_007900 [Thyridium curvatum]TPX11481.1 hypothetical protein E0L32_007900 [Thyridium curvatum]